MRDQLSLDRSLARDRPVPGTQPGDMATAAFDQAGPGRVGARAPVDPRGAHDLHLHVADQLVRAKYGCQPFGPTTTPKVPT